MRKRGNGLKCLVESCDMLGRLLLSGYHSLKLRLVQALVDATGMQQLGMAADGDDSALVEDDDAVGDLQGVEAVGDDEGGAAFDEIPLNTVHFHLVLGDDVSGVL